MQDGLIQIRFSPVSILFTKAGKRIAITVFNILLGILLFRLAPVLKTIYHQCVISYTCRKQFIINVLYHILVASLTLMALF